MGSNNKVFKTLGASNHTDNERHNEDFYATDPIASEWLLKLEELSDVIIDNSYGQGHLMKPMIESGKRVIGYDVVDRGNHDSIEFYEKDFLTVKEIEKGADIVMNPPYSKVLEFVSYSLNLLEKGRKLCAFLKIQFLEGKKRREFFEKNPPCRVWVSSSRILCVKNAYFHNTEIGGGGAIGYAWYIWEKGYKGHTELKWFN